VVKIGRSARVMALGLVFLCGTLLLANEARAQGSASFPSKAPAELYIRNTTNQAIVFSAAIDNGEFASYTVAAGNRFTVSCEGSGCGEMQYFHIRLDSNIDGRTITKSYSETPGTRVQIAWNDSDRCWDFFKDNQ
jgi:hypothetical protein